jgi:large subunit ribosomal protein L4
MPKISVYNSEGKVTGEAELNPACFGVRVNPGLVHEVLVAQMANARRPIAHTKTRGEVRGGGKKPWRQKGTGRARHGSIRSPIWTGGGVTFGPRSARNFGVKINRKARRKALFMVLSDKLANGRLIALESFRPKEPKTRELAALISKLPVKKNALYVIPASRPELVRMARNLKNVYVVTANSLNIADALRYGTVIFEKEAIAAFESVYANEKE